MATLIDTESTLLCHLHLLMNAVGNWSNCPKWTSKSRSHPSPWTVGRSLRSTMMKMASAKRSKSATSRSSPVPCMAVRTGTFSLPQQIQQIKDPTQRGQAIGKLIEGGAFDQAPFEAVDMALAQSHLKPAARCCQPLLAASAEALAASNTRPLSRLNTLDHDRDFAINGLAHGLVGEIPTPP